MRRTAGRIHLSRWGGAPFLALVILVFSLAVVQPASAQADLHDLRSIKRITDYWLSREGSDANPLLLGTKEEYLDALRRMRAGQSQIVGGAELPSADAEIRASECTSCKLILEMIAFFQHSLDELKTEAETLRVASLESGSDEASKDLAEAEGAVQEMEAHLRTLAQQAARCWDECVPPDRAARLFIPTPFEFPVSTYPGEPVTCLACQRLINELRKVNASLFVSQAELDELEALDRYYRSRFNMWDIWIEDADVEDLKAMRALADARARLMMNEPTGEDRSWRGQSPRGPLPDYMFPKGWDDLNRADTIGGRAAIMMEWSYDWIRRQAFKIRNLPNTLPADIANMEAVLDDEISANNNITSFLPDLTVATLYSWLYGAPYQTPEEVRQSAVPDEMSPAQQAGLESLVITAAIALAEKLPPAQKRVNELRQQRRDLLAQIFNCHRRLCRPGGTGTGVPVEPVAPPGVDTAGLIDGSGIASPDEGSERPVDGAGVMDEDPEAGAYPQDADRTDTDDAEMSPADGSGSDTAVDGNTPPTSEPIIGLVPPPQPMDLSPTFEEGDAIIISEGVRLLPDGTFVDEEGTTLSPQDLAGLTAPDANRAGFDPEDPEMGAGDEADVQAQEDAIAAELAAAAAPPERIVTKRIQPLPPVPPVASQCDAAAPASIAACNRLPEPERATCNALAGRRDCLTDLFNRLGGATENSCLVSCEGTAAQQSLNQFILDTGRRIAGQNFQQTLAALTVPPNEADRLFARIAELDKLIADMERGRLVHYYENTNTGEVVEHFGEQFEPVPPLVYRGDGRLPLNAAERARLSERRAERQDLLAQREAILNQSQAQAERSAELNAWYSKALGEVWELPPTAAMWCTRETAVDRYAACRRECVTRGFRDSRCLAQYSDNRPELDTYYQNEGLYPPGFERSPD